MTAYVPLRRHALARRRPTFGSVLYGIAAVPVLLVVGPLLLLAIVLARLEPGPAPTPAAGPSTHRTAA